MPQQSINDGSIAVVSGDQPILVNPTGWLPQADGTLGETFVYADQWGSETRLLTNTFFAAGATQGSQDPTEAATRIQH